MLSVSSMSDYIIVDRNKNKSPIWIHKALEMMFFAYLEVKNNTSCLLST